MASTVLITGASTGIGRAAALRMDSAGWQVLAGVRKPADGEALREAGTGRIEPIVLDVCDPDHIAAARERVGSRLDGLVNNAGIAVAGPAELLDLDDLRRQLEVNVTAQVAVTQALLPSLRAAGGRIVLTGSVGGRTAVPFASPYAISKHGLEALADCLRVELAPWGIKVALLEPGAVKTGIWDKSLGQVADSAAAMSDEERALYGHAITAMTTVTAKTASRGVRPDAVAKAIEHALTASRPRTRYVVGIDARGQMLMRRWLSDRAWDRLLVTFARLPH